MNSWKYIGATTFYKQERQFCSQLQMYFLSARETRCTGAITFHAIFKNKHVMEQFSWAQAKTDAAIPTVVFHPMPPGFFLDAVVNTRNREWGSKFL